MKNRRKSYILLLFVLALSSFVISFATISPANAEKYAIDLFTVNGLKMESDYSAKKTISSDDREGLLFYGNQGGSARFVYGLAGKTQIDLRSFFQDNVFGIPVLKVNIENAFTKEFFSICIASVGRDRSVYVELDGRKAAIVPHENSLMGMSSAYNEAGQFISFSGASSTKLIFDAENMSVYASENGTTEKLVWNFLNEYNDGRRLKALDVFSSYNLSIVLDDCNENSGSVVLYSLNSLDFSKGIIRQGLFSSVTAQVEYNGLVNKEYKIPSPVIQDLANGGLKVGNVKIKVKKGAETVIDTAWKKDLSFVPTKNGIYTLEYSIPNYESVYDIAVYGYSTDNFYFDGEISDCIAGKGAEMLLPAAKIQTNLVKSNDKIYARVKIERNSDTLSDDVANGMFFCFDEIGVYKIAYYSPFENIEAEKVFYVEIKDTIPGEKYVELEKEYTYGTSFTVPELNVVFKNETKKAESIIIFPSGSVYSDSEFYFKEVGNYKIRYSYSFENKEYTTEKNFNVAYSIKDVFTTDSVSDVEYNEFTINNEVKGALVSSGANGKVTYNQVIDLSKNTKDDLLLEIIAQPNTMGVADFIQFTVTLEDIHNSTNCVTITAYDSTLGNCYGIGSYIKAAATGQVLTGREYDDRIWTTYCYGYPIWHSFRGQTNASFGYKNIKDMTFQLYYDYEEKAVYSSVNWTSGEKFQMKNLVCDLDDTYFFSNLWDGFTTGEVKLSISVQGVSAERAKYIIKNINGQSFSSEIVSDVNAPKIYIDSETIPDAVVSYPYAIPSFKCIDDYNGGYVSGVKVFYNGKAGSLVDSYGGVFTPKENGVYSIVYHAIDRFGNTSEYEVRVTAVDSTEEITAELVDGYSDSGVVGQNIRIADVKAKGGSVGADGLRVKTSVVGPKSKNIEIEDNCFIPLEIGEYKVEYSVTDYVGQTLKNKLTYTINISRGDKPILQTEVVMPPIFIAERQYSMPAMFAADYYENAGEPKMIGASVIVKDSKGTKRYDASKEFVYTPAVGQNVEVTYSFTGAGGTLNKSYVIPVIEDINKTSNMNSMANYFYSQNDVEIIPGGANISLIAKESGAEIFFASILDANNFSISASVNPEKNNYDSVSFVIRDVKNVSEYIIFTYHRDGDGVLLSLNNGAPIKAKGTFTGVTSYELSVIYSGNGYRVVDSSGSYVGSVSEFANGERFTGLSSGTAYLSVVFGNISGDSELYLKEINRQPLSRDTMDRIKPSLIVNGDYGGIYQIGSTVIVPTAKAYDVLSDVSKLTVTVLDPDNNPIRAKDGTLLSNARTDKEYTFSVNDVGEYSITYEATDSSKRKWTATSRKIVTVIDNQPPTIKIQGKKPTKVTLNSNVSLPGYKVEDNNGSAGISVQIICISPRGTLISARINDDGSASFVPTERGKWTIRYFAYDEYFNYSTTEFTIEVK